MKYAFAAAALFAGAMASVPAYADWDESTTCTDSVTVPAYPVETPKVPEYQPVESTTDCETEATPVPYQSSTWVTSAVATPPVYETPSVSVSKPVESPSAPVYQPPVYETPSVSVSKPVEAPTQPAAPPAYSPSKPAAAPPAYSPSKPAAVPPYAPSGYMPPKPAPTGTAAPSGYMPAKPSSSPITPYKGAGNALNAAGLLAGAGAFVALLI